MRRYATERRLGRPVTQRDIAVMHNGGPRAVWAKGKKKENLDRLLGEGTEGTQSMNEEFLGMTESVSSTAAFLSNDIQRPPRKPPECRDDEMILSGEYYLDAPCSGRDHLSPSVDEQDGSRIQQGGHLDQPRVWVDWTDQLYFHPRRCERRCWNHAVDNGATRVYMRVKSKQSSKYGGITGDSYDQYVKWRRITSLMRNSPRKIAFGKTTHWRHEDDRCKVC